MLKVTKKIISDVKANLLEKSGLRAVIGVADHFEDRLIERFEEVLDEDDIEISRIERTIEKAIEKLEPSHKATEYVHPAYNIAVVAQKIGLNGITLVTCYKKEVI